MRTFWRLHEDVAFELILENLISGGEWKGVWGGWRGRCWAETRNPNESCLGSQWLPGLTEPGEWCKLRVEMILCLTVTLFKRGLNP